MFVFQVTIEVLEDSQTETEVEMDLVAESQRNDWSLSSYEWISSHKKLFWPLFWEYPDQAENGLGGGQSEDYSYDLEEPVLSGVGGEWGRRWNKEWRTEDNVGRSTTLLNLTGVQSSTGQFIIKAEPSRGQVSPGTNKTT